jgi:hypothetical protein
MSGDPKPKTRLRFSAEAAAGHLNNPPPPSGRIPRPGHLNTLPSLLAHGLGDWPAKTRSNSRPSSFLFRLRPGEACPRRVTRPYRFRNSHPPSTVSSPDRAPMADDRRGRPKSFKPPGPKQAPSRPIILSWCVSLVLAWRVFPTHLEQRCRSVGYIGATPPCLRLSHFSHHPSGHSLGNTLPVACTPFLFNSCLGGQHSFLHSFLSFSASHSFSSQVRGWTLHSELATPFRLSR